MTGPTEVSKKLTYIIFIHKDSDFRYYTEEGLCGKHWKQAEQFDLEKAKEEANKIKTAWGPEGFKVCIGRLVTVVDAYDDIIVV